MSTSRIRSLLALTLVASLLAGSELALGARRGRHQILPKPGQNCAVTVETPPGPLRRRRRFTWYATVRDAAECESVAEAHRFRSGDREPGGRDVTAKFGEPR